MSFWKPDSERIWLLERGIAFSRTQSYEGIPSKGGVAQSHIGWVAMAHLVDMGSTMINLLEPAINGIDSAIADGEDIGPDRFAWYGLLTEAKAIAQWFLTGKNMAATWSVAFDERLAWLRRRAGMPMKAKDLNSLLDEGVAVGYQAGRYEEAIAFHDELAGPMKVSIRNIKAPRQLAYALCLRALGRSPGTEEEFIHAGHRLLQLHLAERWLHLGNFQRAAMWLKIVYEFAEPSLTPAQVMLKAYDDMPTIPRPGFLPAATTAN